MIRTVKTVAWICAVAWTSVCAAQEAKPSDEAKALSERRINLMRQRVETLSDAGAKEEEFAYIEKPLLRYNDTARGIADATVWGLGRKGRPRAVLVVEIYGGDAVQFELSAVAEPPRFVRAGFGATPRAAAFTWLKVPDEAPPHANESIRRRQIKQTAQKFSASEEWRGQTYQLRMMPQPILQYEDKEQGVIEGAVFVWAHGTNVEILMYLEGRQGEDGAKHWAAGFGQLSGADLDVDYNGQDFWNSSQGAAASRTRSYFGLKVPLTAAEREAFAPQ